MKVLLLFVFVFMSASVFAAVISPHDIVVSNVGYRPGHYLISQKLCSFQVQKDPNFNLTRMPYHPSEYIVGFSHPGGYASTSMCSPLFDVSKDDWSIDSSSHTLKYVYSVTGDPLNIEAIFDFDPNTGVINSIKYADSNEVCILH